MFAHEELLLVWSRTTLTIDSLARGVNVAAEHCVPSTRGLFRGGSGFCIRETHGFVKDCPGISSGSEPKVKFQADAKYYRVLKSLKLALPR